MFRLWATRPWVCSSFPRIRGDVPAVKSAQEKVNKFSPHTRGCSADWVTAAVQLGVFPAYAGMFRKGRGVFSRCSGFPRIRGDVPVSKNQPTPTLEFSPHTRGCSAVSIRASICSIVFPAYAGMFRFITSASAIKFSFPRIRGDVPTPHHQWFRQPQFSPHTRGCSEALNPPTLTKKVFPAYAGMFRALFRIFCSPISFPRIRGDVPPHLREAAAEELVFPAYAGMFLPLQRFGISRVGFPRIRGDVPQSFVVGFDGVVFSPHTQGCSEWGRAARASARVFPAYAGIFQRQGLQ